MEWILEYDRFVIAFIFILLGALSLKGFKKDKDDPEMDRVAKALGCMGQIFIAIGIFVFALATIEFLST